MAGERLDLVIVGAGPAGLSAAGHAQDQGLRYLLLERAEHLADTIFAYQKRKHVMAEPGVIPLRSPLPFSAGSRESVLDGWQQFATSRGLALRFRTELTGLERLPAGGFRLTTSDPAATFEAAKVILAFGTQGNPRPIGAPGAGLPHVSTRLVDPDEVRNEDVVVLGAGDSALEVALALTGHNRVSLIVRRPEIVRAKESLEREALARAASGELKIHFSTTVQCIEPGAIVLSGPGGEVRQAASRVIAKLGTEPPRAFLERLGVEFSGPGADAGPLLSPQHETRVPGLYLIGAAAGRDLIKLGANQGFEAVEHVLGREVDPADESELAARLPWWTGKVRARLDELQATIPVLAGCPESELRELFLAAEPRELRADTVVVRQNDYTDSVFLIAAGEVTITLQPEGGGAERTVAHLVEGAFFGEMSLLSHRRRAGTVTTRTPARLFEIPRKAMLKLLAKVPAVAALVDRVFTIRALQSYLLPDVDEQVLAEVARRVKLVSLPRGEVLFREGDAGDAFYLIRSGQVKIAKRSAEREIVLSYLPAGNFFGETALLSGAPRSATVSAIFPTELIRLDREDFARFLAAQPQLETRVRERLEARRVASLVAEATPGAGRVLSELIREEVVMGTDALLIDNHKCLRCNNCVDACAAVHEDGQARLSLTGVTFYNVLAPNSCWQCEDPLCMLDCPPDAIARSATGEVYIKSSCIGCGNCATHCPYGNIFMVHPKPSRWGWLAALFGGAPEANSTVAVKCDLCADRGNDPACVRACPTGAALRVAPERYQETIEQLVTRRGEV